MARLPRNVVSDQPVHVTQRGNNRQAVFFASSDYTKYLCSLRVAAERTACSVHAYVLMTNHAHLLITPSTPASLSRLMQSIGRQYVRYINATYKRTGTLWEGRFNSALVDSDRYLLTCMRYIELNPVRAHMAEEPGDYRWSSYARNALGEPDPIVTSHDLYDALADDLEARQRAYRGFFQGSGRAESSALPSIRSGTQLGLPIGDNTFKARIARLLNRRVEKFPHGGARRGDSFRRFSSTLTP